MRNTVIHQEKNSSNLLQQKPFINLLSRLNIDEAGRNPSCIEETSNIQFDKKKQRITQSQQKAVTGVIFVIDFMGFKPNTLNNQ